MKEKMASLGRTMKRKKRKKEPNTETNERAKNDSRRREGEEGEVVGGRGPVTSHDM